MVKTGVGVVRRRSGEGTNKGTKMCGEVKMSGRVRVGCEGAEEYSDATEFSRYAGVIAVA